MKLFGLLFAVAFLQLASAQLSIRWGYTWEGVELETQTANNVLTFQWDCPSLQCEYSIGTTGSPTLFASPTNTWFTLTPIGIPDSATTNTYLTVTDTSNFVVLPPGVAIVLTIRNKANFTQTSVSSDLFVGSTVDYLQCNLPVWAPQTGQIVNAPPRPTATITFEPVTQRFSFVVVSRYLFHGYTWVLDFARFPNNNALGTFGLGTTACENRLASSISTRQFKELFNAAHRPDFAITSGNVPPQPLNSDNYLAYQHTGSQWTPTAGPACNEITYTGLFTWSSLALCNRTGVPSITVGNDSTSLYFNGTLHVAAIAPISFNNPTLNYKTFEFEFPFRFTWNIRAEAVASSFTQLFTFFIRRVYLTTFADTTVQLNVVIETDSLQSAAYMLAGWSNVTTGAITHSAGGMVFNFVAPYPSVQQVQQWNHQSDVYPIGTSFTGLVTANYDRGYAATTPSHVFLQYNLYFVAEDEVDISKTLGISLGFFDDATYLTPNGGFGYGPGQNVYVLSTIHALEGATIVPIPAGEQNSFDNSIFEAYLCYTTNGAAPAGPTYCSTTAGNVVSIAQLVGDTNGDLVGNVVPAAVATYAPGVNQDIVAKPLIEAGFYFDAGDLAANAAGYGTNTFYVHVVARIGNGVKRDVVVKATVDPAGVSGFRVRAAPAEGSESSSPKEGGGSGVCYPCIALGLGGFAVFVLLVLLFVVFRRRRNEKKQAEKYESEENSNSL